MSSLNYFLKVYLRERPFFLSLIRAKEADLYQKYLPFKRPILDLGCGDGFFAKVTFAKNLKAKGEKLKVKKGEVIDVGLDVAGSRIEEARKLGIYKKLVVYDGKEIPFPDNSFSTVISNSTLEHVEDLEAVLKEIYRVLKPKGLFLATVMAKPWEDYLFGAKLLGSFYRKWMREKQVHVNLLTKEKWEERFKKAGFKIGETVGYLSLKACNWIDLLHHISLPSLITYKLFGRWVIFPQLSKFYPVNYFSTIITPNINSDTSGAIFYVLKK